MTSDGDWREVSTKGSEWPQFRPVPRSRSGEEPMSPAGSVSHWIAALKNGDPAAARPLWERYHRQLVALARKILRSARRRADDEDDVVQNVFHSFFRAVAQGRFPHLDDRNSLWRLLVVITSNKALRQRTHEHRQKRGGTAAGPMGIHLVERDDDDALVRVVGAVPTPEFAAQAADEFRRLLDSLGDETLRQVAVWKMEGYGNHEIADKLECSRRTVARKLEAIRILWSREEPAP
jgi:RNA polymerase sigma factor (sigma-70 family)